MSAISVTTYPSRRPYEDAYQRACEALRNADIQERAVGSGATLEKRDDGSWMIALTFFNKLCEIRFPDIDLRYQEGDEEISLWGKILILHYLLEAKGYPLTGSWINFRELPGGSGYYPAFIKRSQDPLGRFFSSRLDVLQEAAYAFGGSALSYGDGAVTIPALPRVPLSLVVWRGDEEFPAEATILFDATIPRYLPTEDIAVLSQQTVMKLIAWARHRIKNH